MPAAGLARCGPLPGAQRAVGLGAGVVNSAGRRRAGLGIDVSIVARSVQLAMGRQGHPRPGRRSDCAWNWSSCWSRGLSQRWARNCACGGAALLRLAATVDDWTVTGSVRELAWGLVALWRAAMLSASAGPLGSAVGGGSAAGARRRRWGWVDLRVQVKGGTGPPGSGCRHPWRRRRSDGFCTAGSRRASSTRQPVRPQHGHAAASADAFRYEPCGIGSQILQNGPPGCRCRRSVSRPSTCLRPDRQLADQH